MGRHSTRRSRRIGTNGLAAVVAQGSQAAGSLLLQVVLAARSLGITGVRRVRPALRNSGAGDGDLLRLRRRLAHGFGSTVTPVEGGASELALLV